MRRFAHYDYWDDAVRPSVLADAGADLLSYGMGENPDHPDRPAAGGGRTGFSPDRHPGDLLFVRHGAGHPGGYILRVV